MDFVVQSLFLGAWSEENAEEKGGAVFGPVGLAWGLGGSLCMSKGAQRVLSGSMWPWGPSEPQGQIISPGTKL